ncbi:MAG: hypothetical protein A2231_03645 [Candidatus Firestonebacteria bacterium RIFOXYA2_FULL_40_8]|nr:MAG: hypothetical protein A2231_03645 [Candidatus Firestonebacteria bacterium RIFOXYA2_FULL_40_8]
MKKTLCLILMMVPFLLIKTSFADINGASFLSEDIGAKSFGMGSASTAIADGPCGLVVNPAGISCFISPEISANYKKNIMDGFNSSIFCVLPIMGAGVLGTGVALYDQGSIEINYLDGTSETIKAMQNWVFNLGYGVNIVNELSVGVNLKAISSTLANIYSATAFASDFGVLYRTWGSSLSLGVSLQNIGTKLTYISDGDPLPLTLRAGIGYKFRETDIDSWLISGDIIRCGRYRANIGLECVLFKILSIRAGYKFRYDPDSLTLGLGFNVSQIKVDYAYSVLGGLDNIHMFSISYAFDTVKQPEKNTK